MSEFTIRRLAQLLQDGDLPGVGALLALALEDTYQQSSTEDMIDTLFEVNRQVENVRARM